MVLQSLRRRDTQYVLANVIYEIETRNGAGQLLEILGAPSTVFALPLKGEHRDFLFKALTPSHMVKRLQVSTSRSYCMAQYVEEDQLV